MLIRMFHFHSLLPICRFISWKLASRYPSSSHSLVSLRSRSGSLDCHHGRFPNCQCRYLARSHSSGSSTFPFRILASMIALIDDAQCLIAYRPYSRSRCQRSQAHSARSYGRRSRSSSSSRLPSHRRIEVSERKPSTSCSLNHEQDARSQRFTRRTSGFGQSRTHPSRDPLA